MDDRRYLSSREATGVIGVDVDTLIAWAKAGKVPAVLDPGGRYRFWSEDLRLCLRPVRQPDEGEGSGGVSRERPR